MDAHENSGGALAAGVLVDLIGNVAKPPRTHDRGTIQDDFSLRIDGFTSKQNEYMVWRPGQYDIAQRLKCPPDFLATTIDGVRGYYIRMSRDGTGTIIPVALVGPGAGEHSHIGTGGHSHGDPQGGGTGVAEPDIFAQHQEQHYHRVLMPPAFRGIMPGDRVSIEWYGSRPFVADIVVDSLGVENNTLAGLWDVMPGG